MIRATSIAAADTPFVNEKRDADVGGLNLSVRRYVARATRLNWLGKLADAEVHGVVPFEHATMASRAVVLRG